MADEVTWSIDELTRWLDAVIARELGGAIWVEGEISGLSRHASGHVYFSLLGDGEDGPAPKLSVTLFRWHRDLVNQQLRRAGGGVRMEDGVRVRVKGEVGVYAARSQYQLRMTAIDPAFTLGNLAAARAELLARLDAEGLLGANAAVAVPPVPLRLALVTSIGSAAYHDVVAELGGAGVGFEVLAVDARVQGQDAPDSLADALGRAARLGPDLIALVRGGGARTDLVAFDHETVARAVATSAVPVWCGLGHEIDRSVVDEVANRSFKTPTACAAAIAERVLDAGARTEVCFEQVVEHSARHLRGAGERIARTSSTVALRSGGTLEGASRRLELAAHGVAARAGRRLDAGAARLAGAAVALGERPERRLERAGATLAAHETLVRAFDPARSLARGWSITRTADGRLVRDPSLPPGTELLTTVAAGTLRSSVTSASGGPGTVTDASGGPGTVTGDD